MAKNKQLEVSTWPEAESLMAHFAQVECDLEKLGAANLQAMQAQHERYAAQVKPYLEKRQELEKALKKFAGAHKAEFKPREQGGDVRSYDHAGVTLGFRRTPPAVRIEDEEQAITYLCQYYGEEYIRTQFSPDREKLKGALQDGNERLIEALAAHGITLKQMDKFFVELVAK